MRLLTVRHRLTNRKVPLARFFELIARYLDKYQLNEVLVVRGDPPIDTDWPVHNTSSC